MTMVVPYENETSLDLPNLTIRDADGNLTQDDASCTEWLGTSSKFLQAGNCFHLVAFLIPHNFSASSFFVRFLILVGLILYTLWAALDVCAADIFVWNCSLVLLNFAHTSYLAFKLFPPIIPDHLTDLYTKLFQPLKVSRRQFRTLTRAAEVNWLNAGQVYAKEETLISDQHLSILLQGKIKVTCDDAHLHYVFPNQFIDSPEWEAAESEDTENYYQVTLMAEEKSRYITWSRKRLKQLLATKPYLETVVSCLIGKDITLKLYSLNEYQHRLSSEQSFSILEEIDQGTIQRSRSVDAFHISSLDP